MFEELMKQLLKPSTEKQFESIWMHGLMYHCKELSGFMVDHVNDDYFNNTDKGRQLKCLVAELLRLHVRGMMILSLPDDEKGDEDGDEKTEQEVKPPFDLEALLSKKLRKETSEEGEGEG